MVAKVANRFPMSSLQTDPLESTVRLELISPPSQKQPAMIRVVMGSRTRS